MPNGHMSKVIDGRRYNTETADEVGSTQHAYPRDFRYFAETLYKTKNGRFFIAGEGGPKSRWSKSDGNMTSGSKGIRAYSEPDALEWCETHNIDADVIELHFDVEEA